jgi:hypothetical protein
MVERVDHEPTRVRRKAVLIGLLINVLVFFCLSFLLWGVRYRSAVAVALSPIAPVYFGIIFSARGDTDVAIVSCGVSVAAAILVPLAIGKPNTVRTVLAHVALALYWFWSFCIIGIGV